MTGNQATFWSSALFFILGALVSFGISRLRQPRTIDYMIAGDQAVIPGNVHRIVPELKVMLNPETVVDEPRVALVVLQNTGGNTILEEEFTKHPICLRVNGSKIVVATNVSESEVDARIVFDDDHVECFPAMFHKCKTFGIQLVLSGRSFGLDVTADFPNITRQPLRIWPDDIQAGGRNRRLGKQAGRIVSLAFVAVVWFTLVRLTNHQGQPHRVADQILHYGSWLFPVIVWAVYRLVEKYRESLASED